MPLPVVQNGMHEDCGIVGVYSPGRNAAAFVHRALHALQHRGQEGAGIVTTDERGTLSHLKARGLVAEALPTYRVQELTGPLAIGHVRYSTVPADRSENIQPFIATLPQGPFALAHNGNLKNAEEVRATLERGGSLMSTSMDTELIAHLIALSGEEDFSKGLKAAADNMQGAYSLTMLANNKGYAFRDPHGVRPLVLGKLDDGWVVASETCALDILNAEYIRPINPGELLCFSESEPVSQQLLEPQRPGPCVFELVYFARPDSVVFEKSVHSARTKMGLALAKADAGQDIADIVVPVPDSGFPAAIGYARQSELPLEKAIIRSHYVGRTFILPAQDTRTHTIQMKLSVIRDVVKGKRVLLVDDSIVRGNTSRKIVQMVREAGAREVHLRIASPPLAWPCYLGIDTPTRDELLINTAGSVAAACEQVGADSLDYLTLDALKGSVGGSEYCFGCMTGDYPV